MARGRMISKSLSTSRKYGLLYSSPLGEFCQALYPLLVAHADDFGVLEGDAFTVKHAIVPASPRSEAEVEEALTLLTQVCLITRGDGLLQITDFDRHQSGLHKRVSGNFREIPGTSGKRPELPGTSRNFPETSGTSGKVPKIPTLTELNLTELNVQPSVVREPIAETPKVNGNGHGPKSPPPAGPAKEPPEVKSFLLWFQREYKTRRHGADYLVKWARDAPIVKQLLAATPLDRLKRCAVVLLSENTDDEFIVKTDRGITILSARFNWLSDRVARWEASQ